MKRELDEIEAEMGPRPFSLWEQVALLNRTMGKERTLKVGDRVKTIDGKVGVIHECSPCDQYWIDFGDGEGYDAYTPWQLQCIPVEPERVCDPSWAQRAGMGPDNPICKRKEGCAYPKELKGIKCTTSACEFCGTADRAWYAVGKSKNGGYPLISGQFSDKATAEALAEAWGGVALRWQDGVQG